MAKSTPSPGARAPSLSFRTQHGEWTLAGRKPDAFTMIVFYRGRHCPQCRRQLEELSQKLPKFTERGVDVVAVSMDDEEAWTKTRKEWDVGDLAHGYGLDRETAEDWGLYFSSSIKDEEPDIFTEPGLFLVKPDGTLYAASIQSMPFARPPLDQILSAVDFVLENDYPPRGVRG